VVDEYVIPDVVLRVEHRSFVLSLTSHEQSLIFSELSLGDETVGGEYFSS